MITIEQIRKINDNIQFLELWNSRSPEIVSIELKKQRLALKEIEKGYNTNLEKLKSLQLK